MLTGRFVFQYLGWRVAAMATPAIMFVTGGAFFGLSIAATAGGSSLAVGHFNMASAGALAGAVTQVCIFSRILLRLSDLLASIEKVSSLEIQLFALELPFSSPIAKQDSCISILHLILPDKELP